MNAKLEFLEIAPHVDVAEAEYFRLLGYPPGMHPGARGRELAAWARQWYAENGRPWIYAREAAVARDDDTLRLDGVAFHSQKLSQQLQRTKSSRVALVAIGAGRACEEHAQALWRDERPDEYFFLEIFGSAVVEHLLALVSGRLCAHAERDGLIAVAPYSPGYAGWDVAEQPALFELILRGSPAAALPEPLEVLPSGMLRPKKAQLAVFGLTARTPETLTAARFVPCDRCSFHPCQYRRRPYRHARAADAPSAPVGELSTASAPSS